MYALIGHAANGLCVTSLIFETKEAGIKYMEDRDCVPNRLGCVRYKDSQGYNKYYYEVIPDKQSESFMVNRPEYTGNGALSLEKYVKDFFTLYNSRCDGIDYFTLVEIEFGKPFTGFSDG